MEYRIFRILDLISIKDENIFEISVSYPFMIPLC